MPGTYSRLLYHVVFSTKRRTQTITESLRPRLYDYMGGIIRSERGVSYEIGGTADHVHLLFRWRTDESLAALMRNVKSHSSRWVHQTFPTMGAFQWQEGYAAFSVSESQREAVANYIRNQAEHHRSLTFEDELVRLLEAHNIEYDARYLWD